MKYPDEYLNSNYSLKERQKNEKISSGIEDIITPYSKKENYEIGAEEPIQLNRLDYGCNGTIIQTPKNPLMHALGLRPGKKVCNCGYQLFGGPMIVKIEERQVALNKQILKHIYISPEDYSGMDY